MHTKQKIVGFKVFLIMLLPVAGASLMYALTYAFQLEEDSFFRGLFYTLALIFLGLGIPFAMLKTLFSAAHTQNPKQEKNLHLNDIPDYKDDANRKLSSRKD